LIPQAYIREWTLQVPWSQPEQVEQDLIICRALVEIFSDKWLSESLAFRGGTALHKLFLQPPPRYSEDIDLVQIRPEPIKTTVQRLQKSLSFLGKSSVEPRKDAIRIRFRFESEFLPVKRMMLKVEANTREHFSVLGYQKKIFSVRSQWFEGSCNITTYQPEELLGTKLRALYQRSKGRDLFDLAYAFELIPDLNTGKIIHCYQQYMQHSVAQPPSQGLFIRNLDAKMQDSEFLGDIKGLLRPEIHYDHQKACDLVKTNLIEKI
jgi:predicted nucleotidyltransferase component of viral defense system